MSLVLLATALLASAVSAQPPSIATANGSLLSLAVPSDGGVFVQYGDAALGQVTTTRHVAGTSEEIFMNALSLGYMLGHDLHTTNATAFSQQFDVERSASSEDYLLGVFARSAIGFGLGERVGEVSLRDNVDSAVALGYKLAQGSYDASDASLEKRMGLLSSALSEIDDINQRLGDVYTKDGIDRALEKLEGQLNTALEAAAKKQGDQTTALAGRVESTEKCCSANGDEIKRVAKTQGDQATALSRRIDAADQCCSTNGKAVNALQTSSLAKDAQIKKLTKDVATAMASLSALSKTVETIAGQLVSSCNDARVAGEYTVQGVKQYCQKGTDGKFYSVIQRRVDSTNFYVGWGSYKQGFGNRAGSFWLGNDNIAKLTSEGNWCLRIELERSNRQKKFASYAGFQIGYESEGYRLKKVGSFSGNVGDSFSSHKNMRFSTYDRDNDTWGSNCAARFKGAWWYSNCHSSNLNGKYMFGGHGSYADGVNWASWTGYYESLKSTMMMRQC